MFPEMKIRDSVVFYRTGDFAEDPATGWAIKVHKNGKLDIVVWVGTEMKQYKNRRHISHPDNKKNPTALRNEGCWLTVDEHIAEDESKKVLPLHVASRAPDEIATKLGWTIDHVLDWYNRVGKNPHKKKEPQKV